MAMIQAKVKSAAELQKELEQANEELKRVKAELARMRRENQKEGCAEKTGMREFLLEIADERFGKYYTPEKNFDFFDNFYACIKRKVKKKSTVLGVECGYFGFVFCEDAVYVFENDDPPEMYFKIKYEAIADVDYGGKSGDNWIDFTPVEGAYENEDLVKRDYNGDKKALEISSWEDGQELYDVYKFLLDILEHINPY